MQDKVYITDTSALYCLFAGKADFGKSSGWQKQAGFIVKKIFKEKKIIIPMSAMTEMMGQLFHKQIKLEKYDTWYKQRKVLFDQYLINPIFNEGQVEIEHGSPEAGRIALELGNAPIPEYLLNTLRSYHEGRIENNNRINEQRTKQGKTPYSLPFGIPKLFDGMDAMIMGEAIRIALKNPQKEHFLLCSDLWWKQGFDFAKHQSGHGEKLRNFKFLRIEKSAPHVGIKW